MLLDEGPPDGVDAFDGGSFDSGGSGAAGEPHYSGRRREGLPALVGGLLIAGALLVTLLVYWRFFHRVTENPVESPELALRPSTPPPPAAVAPPPPEPVELPLLEESDPFIRGAVATLSARPELVRWLATDSLVERFVATVDNVARGESPRKHLGFLAPKGRFEVAEAEGEVRANPATYDRYDLLTQVILSLDTEGVAETYAQILPLLDEGYQRLGYPAGAFENVLAQAFQRLNRVAVAPDAPALEPRLKSYHFADPELEALGEAEKHLLRLGPENGRQVQLKLRQLGRALGLDG